VTDESRRSKPNLGEEFGRMFLPSAAAILL